MRTFSLSEARKKFAAVLDEAARSGEVRITRRDGRSFIIQPAETKRSPLDVPGIGTRMTSAEVVKTIRTARRRLR